MNRRVRRWVRALTHAESERQRITRILVLWVIWAIIVVAVAVFVFPR